MEIQNSTSDDAMIKVTGGPGGISKGPPREVQFPLKAGEVWTGQNLRPGSLPAFPWTVHFFARVNHTDVQSTTAAKRLTLTKVTNDGYKVKKQ